jgi:hypothetical protein
MVGRITNFIHGCGNIPVVNNHDNVSSVLAIFSLGPCDARLAKDDNGL